MRDQKICGIDKDKYLLQGLNQLEEIRKSIEEKLFEIDVILFDMSQVPELRKVKLRADSYWLMSIKCMLRDTGSTVNMNDTNGEIRRALDDYINQKGG